MSWGKNQLRICFPKYMIKCAYTIDDLKDKCIYINNLIFIKKNVCHNRFITFAYIDKTDTYFCKINTNHAILTQLTKIAIFIK